MTWAVVRTSERAHGQWECGSCVAQGAKSARGDCGGPFTSELVQIEGPERPRGDGWEGVRVEADGRVCISGDWTGKPSQLLEGHVFYSCPVAATGGPVVGEAFRLHRAVERGTLLHVEPHPSAAAMDAIDTVALALADLRKWERDADNAEREATRGRA